MHNSKDSICIVSSCCSDEPIIHCSGKRLGIQRNSGGRAKANVQLLQPFFLWNTSGVETLIVRTHFRPLDGFPLPDLSLFDSERKIGENYLWPIGFEMQMRNCRIPRRKAGSCMSCWKWFTLRVKISLTLSPNLIKHSLALRRSIVCTLLSDNIGILHTHTRPGGRYEKQSDRIAANTLFRKFCPEILFSRVPAAHGLLFLLRVDVSFENRTCDNWQWKSHSESWLSVWRV